MKIIPRKKISGTLTAPPAKSHAQRLLLSALLAKGETTVYKLGEDDDTLCMQRAIEGLGAKCVRDQDTLLISGEFEKDKDIEINAGESGLAARLLIATAALRRGKTKILARSTLLARPMDPLITSLKARSILVQSRRGKLPVLVQGPMIGGYYKIDGRMSSQFVSALLFALASTGRLAVLEFGGLVSRGYLEMTISVLKNFGIKVDVNWKHGTARIEGGQQMTGAEAIVEGDWSAGSTLLIGAALGGEICLEGLFHQSVHPDRIILDVMTACGVEMDVSPISVTLKKANLRSFHFDGTHYPDILPGLAILACFCDGKTKLTGMQRLIYKESNRYKVLLDNLMRSGVKVDASQDEFVIHGGGDFSPDLWETHGDHRMAMAAALFALGSGKEVELDNGKCVNKSYPNFFKDLETLGVEVHE